MMEIPSDDVLQRMSKYELVALAKSIPDFYFPFNPSATLLKKALARFRERDAKYVLRPIS